jgi:hypothetical protein
MECYPPLYGETLSKQRRPTDYLYCTGAGASPTEQALIGAQQCRFVAEMMDTANSDGNDVLKINPQMDALNRTFAGMPPSP